MKKLVFASLITILVIAFSFGEAKAINTDDVVLALSFDEGRGEVTHDLSPLGNDGTLMGSPKWVKGISGKALSFERGAYVEVANESDYDFESTDSFSISSWVKTSNKEGDNFIVAKELNSAGYVGYYYIIDNGGVPGAAKHNGNVTAFIESVNHRAIAQGNTDVRDGKWHHVAFTYDGTTLAEGFKIYVDGRAEELETLQDDMGKDSILTDVPVTIGSRENGGVGFIGAIDEVLIFKKALSAQEIRQVYQVQGVENVLAVQPQGKLATTWSAIKSDYVR